MKRFFTEKDIKKAYDQNVRSESRGDYEKYRWFSDEQSRLDYAMTLNAILRSLKGVEFKNCMEVGAGPGTWTKIIKKSNPGSKILIVDISKEMLKQAKENLKGYGGISFHEGNFLDIKLNQRFDMFFSSRAIEYMPDKEKLVDNIHLHLNSGGTGIIISKPPHPIKLGFRKLLGKKIDPMHLGRVSANVLGEKLKRRGFKSIESYPVIIPPRLPLFSPGIRLSIFKLLYKRPLNLISRNFSESYLIKFRK